MPKINSQKAYRDKCLHFSFSKEYSVVYVKILKVTSLDQLLKIWKFNDVSQWKILELKIEYDLKKKTDIYAYVILTFFIKKYFFKVFSSLSDSNHLINVSIQLYHGLVLPETRRFLLVKKNWYSFPKEWQVFFESEANYV